MPAHSFAAHFFIETSKRGFVEGEDLAVVISLDTENQSINAVEGKLLYPEDILKLTEIRDGNSGINFWIEKPQVSTPGTVIFSGITPAGFIQSKAFIYTVIFRVKKDGEGEIRLDDLGVLKNDGVGTAVPVQAPPFAFSVSDEYNSNTSVIGAVEDQEPPEDFRPEVAQDPDLFDGKSTLLFATQDKGSGIQYYEIREGSWGSFHKAESPYLIHNQSLTEDLYVRAVDRSNNKRVAVLLATHERSGYPKWIILCILILVCLLLLRRLQRALK
jgi:hypothetical protein